MAAGGGARRVGEPQLIRRGYGAGARRTSDAPPTTDRTVLRMPTGVPDPRPLPLDLEYLQQVLMELLEIASPSGRTDHVM